MVDLLMDGVAGPDSIGFISSSKCTNEESFLKQKLARSVIGTNKDSLRALAAAVDFLQSIGRHLLTTENPLPRHATQR